MVTRQLTECISLKWDEIYYWQGQWKRDEWMSEMDRDYPEALISVTETFIAEQLW